MRLSVIVDADRVTDRAAGHITAGVRGRPPRIVRRALDRIACDAALEVVIRDGVDLLAARRYAPEVTLATRRAVAARDGGCRFPGCTAPVSWCDVHHVRPRATEPTRTRSTAITTRPTWCRCADGTTRSSTAVAGTRPSTRTGPTGSAAAVGPGPPCPAPTDSSPHPATTSPTPSPAPAREPPHAPAHLLRSWPDPTPQPRLHPGCRSDVARGPARITAAVPIRPGRGIHARWAATRLTPPATVERGGGASLGSPAARRQRPSGRVIASGVRVPSAADAPTPPGRFTASRRRTRTRSWLIRPSVA